MSPNDLRLVLVHGLWDDPRIFNRLTAYLAQKNVLTFAPYLPHHGGRTPLRDCAVELNRLILDRFGVSHPVALLGFSMGASLAGFGCKRWVERYELILS